MEGSKFTSQQHGVLDAFKRLKYPAVFYPEVPGGRFACYIFIKDGGFVWVEPGYQDPWDRLPRLRCIDESLSIRGNMIVFNSGWIGEGDADEGREIWRYWLDYRRQFDRSWEQERHYVLVDCLKSQWQGEPLY